MWPGGCSRDRRTETLEELRRLSRGALAQMRTLLLELHDEPLEQMPIDYLLRQLVDAMEGRVATICRFETRGDSVLTPVLHRAVYRVVQEALNNVSQHATRRARLGAPGDVHGPGAALPWRTTGGASTPAGSTRSILACSPCGSGPPRQRLHSLWSPDRAAAPSFV